MREELARLLDGLTGSVRFSDTDPRWDSLLRCGERVLGLSLSEAKVSDFCDSMVRNNPRTGNFGSLLVLTATMVDEAVSNAVALAASGESIRNGKAGVQHVTPEEVASADAAREKLAGFSRALAALRLTRLFATRMVATLDASQLRAQVYTRGRRYRGDGDGGSGGGGGGGFQGEAAVVGPNTIVRSKVGGEQGIAGVAITEGREEREHAAVSGRHGDDDPVVALLASLVALCIAEEEKEDEGRGGVALSVEGFTDVQLEGVSLLLVLLGTQAYGPPPSPHAPSMRAPNSSPQASGSQDNVFLDALLREARTKRAAGGGRNSWGVALPRAALGWFIRRPGAAPGSAASALVNALRAPPSARRFSADVNKRSSERRPQNQRPRAEYESLPTHASSGSALVSQGGSASQQARRILAAPGALVLFVARAILYIITLRGLLGVANGSGGGSGGGVGAGGSAAQCPDEDVVTEAPGGAPAEPGEWEGNPQAAGKRGGEASRKISPLADRGLLLLLVLLHNRRSSMSPTANAFRAAVASCVDADLDDYNPSSKRRTPRGAAVAGAGTGGAAFSSSSVSSPAAAEPMRVSFRGMFEAFASTLEASPSRGGGIIAGVGIGGDATEWGESVGREGVALLLYSLLQANPGFLRAAVVRSDADVLLLPLLRTLHDCASPAASAKEQQKQQQKQKQQQLKLKLSKSPPALYVPAIVVLLFSQDSAFDRQAFRQVVQRDVPWCSTRNLKGASLGSLIVLCVLRCLGHNLSRLKDGYLLENCLAVLINLAPQTEHLQPYAAQRLVSVLVAASRRWIEGASSAAAAAVAAAAVATASGDVARVGVGGVGDSENVGGLTDVQELCGEVARVLFLFVWTCTRPRRLGRNVELLYALLHEQASLDAVWNHPAMAATGWAADLPRLLEHFQDLARQEEEAGGAGLTVETAMKMVEKGVRHYTTEALGMGRDSGGDAAEDGRGGGGGAPVGGGGAGAGGNEDEVITLLYEEGENSEDFFLPYLWELVIERTPDLNWNSARISIFSYPGAGQQGAGGGARVPCDDERAPLLDAGGRQGNGGDSGGVGVNGPREEIDDLVAGDMSV